MTSYVVIYGQPAAASDTPEAQAVLIVDDTTYRCISPDDTWLTRVKDIASGAPADTDLLDYITRDLYYWRIGAVTPLDSPIDEAADVLERLYFS